METQEAIKLYEYFLRKVNTPEELIPIMTVAFECGYAAAKEGGRFTKPTSEELIKMAIVFLDEEVIDLNHLTDCVSLCEFITNRLYENGDIYKPTKQEIIDKQVNSN